MPINMVMLTDQSSTMQQQQETAERGCTRVHGALGQKNLFDPLTALLLRFLDCNHDEEIAAVALEVLQAHRRCQLSEFLLLPPLQQA